MNNQLWHLVARKLSGEATLDELRELDQILRYEPELAYQVRLYTGYYESPTRTMRTADDKELSWQNLKGKLTSEFPADFAEASQITATKPSRQKWLAAASIIVIATLAIGYLFLKPRKEVANAEALVNEMKTMPGTRTKMVLPDGSQVWLNSDSYITYNKDFGKSKREVTLNGEAYFDVFHNPDVPMVVHARSVNIWVKGTAFNVKNYPETESIETSLIRGSVELTTNDDPARKILLKPNEKINIDTRTPLPTSVRKHEQAAAKTTSFHIDALRESALSRTIPEVSWIQNKLVFDNEDFAAMVLRMEKWYNVHFVVQNRELLTKRFSGAFEKESLHEALSALQLINHFEFIINGDQVLIK